MQKFDAPQLAERLNALAEVFDKKPVSAKALEVWFDTLREFSSEVVMGLLGSWAKTHGKFPAPQEVWKALNDFSIEDRERKAKSEKAAREREIERMPRTPEGERILRLIQDGLKRPKPSPLNHWLQTAATPGLPWITSQLAKEALKKLQPLGVEREPGQDDEELLA